MDHIREILGNATMARTKLKEKIDEKEIINEICNLLKKAKIDIKKANEIDIKNENGIEIDIQTIEEIQNKIINTTTQNIKEIGTICIVYDSNTYCLIELILKAILTHCSIILINQKNYMKATNELIIALVHRALKQKGIDENLIQQIEPQETKKILLNSASINRVIAIGNRKLQEEVRQQSKIEVISSGFNNIDIYIEDNTAQEIIQQIKENTQTHIYVKKGIKVPFQNYIEVQDIEEAIAIINYNTAGYSGIIYTQNNENKNKFIKEIHTENTAVNEIPTINKILNININKFLITKEKEENNNYKSPNENLETIELPEIKEETTQPEKTETEPIKEIEQPEIDMQIEEKNTEPSEIDQLIENEEPEKPQENIEVEMSSIDWQHESEILKEDNESIKKGNLLQIQQKDKEIEELTKRLEESQQLARKYMDILKKSALCRLFGNLNKQELDQDQKLLS